MDYRIQKKTLI